MQHLNTELHADACNCCRCLRFPGLVLLRHRNSMRQLRLTEAPRDLREVRRLFSGAFPDCRGADDAGDDDAGAAGLYLLDRERNLYRQLTEAGDVRPNSVLRLHDEPPPSSRSAESGSDSGAQHQQNEARQTAEADSSAMQHRRQQHPQHPQHQQQQELVCTCPHEVQQAMHEAQYYWHTNRPLPQEIFTLLSHQSVLAGSATAQHPSKLQPVSAAVNHAASVDAHLSSLPGWHHQHHHHQHHQHHQHQQMMRQQTTSSSLPVRSSNAPSNSSLDSAFSGQSINSSDVSSGSTQVAAVSAAASRLSVRASSATEGLRRVRAETAQLRADLQSLRAAHQGSVRAMHEMFADTRLHIETFLSNLPAPRQPQGAEGSPVIIKARAKSGGSCGNRSRTKSDTAVRAGMSEQMNGRETVLLDGALRGRSGAQLDSRGCCQTRPSHDFRIRTVNAREPTLEQRRVLMRSIEAVVPDHDARMRGIRAIDMNPSEHHKPRAPPSLMEISQRRQRAVAFSDTVKVDGGRELIRLNCPGEPPQAHQMRDIGGANNAGDVWKRQQPELTADPHQQRASSRCPKTAAAPAQSLAVLQSLNCSRPSATKH